MKKITQPLQICIGPTIRISRESWCLPYAGFFKLIIGQTVYCSEQFTVLWSFCVLSQTHLKPGDFHTTNVVTASLLQMGHPSILQHKLQVILRKIYLNMQAKITPYYLLLSYCQYATICSDCNHLVTQEPVNWPIKACCLP